MYNCEQMLHRVYESELPSPADILSLLSLEHEGDIKKLFKFADAVREKFMGEGILVRGIVEFSNECRNGCHYCGLNRNNKKLPRYRLSGDEIITSIKRLTESCIKTVVLQSGEDDGLDPLWLSALIARIKREFNVAITLSVGERTRDAYRMWRETGADRYLLKIETSSKALYESLHPGMSFENRLRCLDDLKKLGYQTGSGIIVGLKGQTLGSLADDIIFFKQHNFDMIGIGPFISHGETELSEERQGDALLTLKVVALTRIVTKVTHIPATTALGSIGQDFRTDALKAGANVLMPNFTPVEYKKLYEIYPNKRCIGESDATCVSGVVSMARTIGREIDFSRGDSIKQQAVAR